VICRRCGREQPPMFSPCPVCGLVGSASSIPRDSSKSPHDPMSTARGGEAEPTRSDASDAAVFAYAITDGDLRAAFMAAHRAWARRWAPHLLKEWP